MSNISLSSKCWKPVSSKPRISLLNASSIQSALAPANPARECFLNASGIQSAPPPTNPARSVYNTCTAKWQAR
jgi:hypothetical protein